MPLSPGRAVASSWVTPEQWWGWNGPSCTGTMTSPHNRQQTAASAALQVEPAVQVTVTPRRTHRPRTPARKSHSLSAECHGGEIKGASGPEMATSKRHPEVLFYGAREMVQSLFTTVPPLECQLQEGRNLTFIFSPMFSVPDTSKLPNSSLWNGWMRVQGTLMTSNSPSFSLIFSL